MTERTQAEIGVANGFGRKPDIVIASNLLGTVLGLQIGHVGEQVLRDHLPYIKFPLNADHRFKSWV
jgi:hypothetical protein